MARRPYGIGRPTTHEVESSKSFASASVDEKLMRLAKKFDDQSSRHTKSIHKLANRVQELEVRHALGGTQYGKRIAALYEAANAAVRGWYKDPQGDNLERMRQLSAALADLGDPK